MSFQRKRENLRDRPRVSSLIGQNTKLARKSWEITAEQVRVLKTLTQEFRLSVALGDLKLLDTRWYVTHSGLLRLAKRNRCAGIQVRPMREFSDPATDRWVFRAVVHKSHISKPFVGYGDADPSNTSPLVRGAEMRVAETRAVNRALRKAYGIGLCSVEEIGMIPNAGEKLPPQNTNGNGTGPKVRDRLCQIIRQHKLDAELVKAYAVDFCS